MCILYTSKSRVLCNRFEVFKRKDVSKYKYGYCYEFCPNCYAHEWPQLCPLIDFAWVCDFVNVRFSKSMAQSRIHRKNSKFISNFATVVLGSFICQRNKIFQSQTISKCRIDGKLNVLCMMLISILHHCSLSR